MYKERIEKKLMDRFSPRYMVIRDDSHQHEGHAGSRPEGETHFHVTIEAESFRGLSRVAAQRLIMSTIKEEMDEHIHALGLTVLMPK